MRCPRGPFDRVACSGLYGQGICPVTLQQVVCERYERRIVVRAGMRAVQRRKKTHVSGETHHNIDIEQPSWHQYCPSKNDHVGHVVREHHCTSDPLRVTTTTNAEGVQEKTQIVLGVGHVNECFCKTRC